MRIDYDGLSEYRDAIGECPRLTKAEESEAAKRKDWDLLVRSQIPLTLQIAGVTAKQWKFSDVPLLASAGMLALVKAVRKFDAALGYRLTTYVYRPITWACVTEAKRSLHGCAPRKGNGRYRATELWGDRPPQVPTDGLEEDHVDNNELFQLAIGKLSSREAEIMWLIALGFDQQDLAMDMGVSRQRVSQIKIRSLDKARVALGQVQW